jgi:hypothetical protein
MVTALQAGSTRDSASACNATNRARSAGEMWHRASVFVLRSTDACQRPVSQSARATAISIRPADSSSSIWASSRSATSMASRHRWTRPSSSTHRCPIANHEP